jgi:steroid delta-isomerase-like uncharacterized protein
MSTAALIERFYAAYNRHDVDAVGGLYAEQAVHHEVAQCRHGEGRDAIVGGLRHFLGAFPDARWEVTRQFVDGDGAAVSYRLTGTLATPLGPFDTPGRALDLEGVHLFECADGAITATADYWDAATFARQMLAGA